MSQNADINITIRGSSAQTMRDKAVALDALAGSLIRMNGALAVAGGSAGVGRATQNITRYGNAIQNAATRTDRFGTSVGSTGNALDNFGTLFSRMVRIMTAYFIISHLTALTKEFVVGLAEAPAKMELWSTQLRVLIGNATVAAEKMELLKTVAIETPLELPDLTEGLIVLQAFRVEVSEHTLPLIADLSAASGRTFRDVSEVIGKVIAGSAPAITRSLPTMGIDPNEFKKLAAELGSRSEAIFQIIAEKFGGFAKESASTVLGVLSNIKDAFFVVLSEIGAGLLPLERQILGGVLESLTSLRQNEDALDHFRITIRSVGEELVSAAKYVIDFAKAIWSLVQALGGLRSIIEVLAGIWLVRFIANLALGLRTLNPWMAALVGLAGIISIVRGRMNQQEDATNRARVAQDMFGESLQRTNELYLKSVNLVDAVVAKRQAAALMGMVGSGDVILSQVQAGDVSGVKAFVDQYERLMAGSGKNNTVVTQIRQLMDWIDNPGLRGNRTELLRGVAIGLAEVMKELAGGAGHFNKIATEAQTAADAARGVASATGEIVDTLKKVSDHDLSDVIGNMRKQFFDEKFIQPADMVMARVTMSGLRNNGVVDAAAKAQAVTQLKQMRAQLVTEADALMASQNDLDIEIGLKLIAKVQNIDTFVNDLTKTVKDPISDALESALRSAVQRGVDGFADAIGQAIAGDESFGNGLKKAFGGILNAVGDLLIQLGLAQIALAGVVQAIRGLVGSPAAGIAAVAAGLALKVAANALIASASNRASSATGGSAGTTAGGTFAPFTAPSAQQRGGDTYNIHAVDAKSLKQMADANPAAFASAVQHVARRDKDTGGSAYGVFRPGTV